MIKELLSIFRDSPNSFDGQEKDEEVILLLRKHPFVIYIRIGFISLAFLIPIIIGTASWPYLEAHDWRNLFLFATSVWYLGLWLAIFHSLTIYTLSTVVITDRRVIDSDQCGLFDRKVSELHTERIQDVSIHTSGIIETFLKFGDVTVQTAGAEKRFIFHKVPSPEKVKEVIMQITALRHSGTKAARTEQG